MPRGQVTLDIRIAEEGPPTKADRIEIEGNERDSDADVLAYLGLREGQPINEAMRSQLLTKLWMSGRYLKQAVTLKPATQPGGQTVLHISLQEYPLASPIASPLSVEEQTLLRCRDWVLAAIERGETVSIRAPFSTLRLQCATAKGKGALCFVEPLDGEQKNAKPDSAPRACLLAATTDDVLLAYDGAKQSLQVPVVDAQINLNIHLDAADPAKEPGRSMQLAVGAGFSSKQKSSQSEPFLLRVTAAPVSIVALLHRESVKTSTADGVLTIESDGAKFRVEIATGRLLECKMPAAVEGGEPIAISVGVENFATLMAEARQRLGTDPGALPNAYASARSVSSIAEFALRSPLVEWLFHWQEVTTLDLAEWRTACRAVAKLLAADVLAPVDEFVLDFTSTERRDFVIPDPLYDAKKLSGDELLATFINGFARVAVQGADQTFPRNSWPWTSTRSLSLVMLGRAGGGDLLGLLQSKEFGPVGRLIWATASEYMSGEIAAGIARSGFDHVNLSGFRADYAPLLAPDKHAGRIVLRLAEMLRDLEPEETAVLAKGLFGERAKLLTNATQRLRESSNEPIEKALPLC